MALNPIVSHKKPWDPKKSKKKEFPTKKKDFLLKKKNFLTKKKEFPNNKKEFSNKKKRKEKENNFLLSIKLYL